MRICVWRIPAGPATTPSPSARQPSCTTKSPSAPRPELQSAASASSVSSAVALGAWRRSLSAAVDTYRRGSHLKSLLSGFLVYNTTAPAKTAEDMAVLFRSYLAEVEALNGLYTCATYTAPWYVEHRNATNGLYLARGC
ncbi:hypothetical protein F4779DRAFT_40311 [Xylariaceae sp. FL0662B]|nr:hypothetical protein F4779DRAFT_40311 [Xylariaceae sp. FL0662B]